MKLAIKGAALGAVSFLVGCATDPSTEPDPNPNPTPTVRKCASRDVPAAEAMQIDLGVPGGETDPGQELAPVSYTIKVHTHVIRDANGGGDITDAMIQAQIDVLNDAYAGKTGGAKMPFKFVNVDTDRTNNAAWFTVTPGSSAETDMKTTLRKGGAADLNMYYANIGDGLLGWATFPSDFTSEPKMDGVVILNTSLPGGGANPFDEGDTATHEVGHWVGLFHTFQNGCTAPGDLVKDTPRVAQPNFGKPAPGSVDSCASDPGQPARADLTNNFMDYVDDDTMNAFTAGQVSRAKRYFEKFRLGQ
jgi:hypothetical protein